tara:strand:+ start:1172 stop:1741 length:570 start_codon:yes stop_codon:yes gene_type:complete
MLDLESGPVHISVEEGIGGTSLCLSLAAKVLQSNSRVVWLGRTPLNSERTKAILAELNENQLERLFIVEFGENLLARTTALKPLINRLTDADLIVIDDWCPSSGRAPANDLQAVRSIIPSAGNTRLIITSKAYESPSGDGEKWKSRGSQLSGVRQVWLLRQEGFRNHRRIIDGEIQTRLLLEESGFIPD